MWSIFSPYSTWEKSFVEQMKHPGFRDGPAVFVVNDEPTGEKTTVGILLSMALLAVGQACCWRSSRTTSSPSGFDATDSAIHASASALLKIGSGRRSSSMPRVFVAAMICSVYIVRAALPS